jgi:lipopolysaccharide export system protein LptA
MSESCAMASKQTVKRKLLKLIDEVTIKKDGDTLKGKNLTINLPKSYNKVISTNSIDFR